uniref:(northern house mosquito) hypothetical protein n=1 Tax=Culex pipiens TaxID=7175 RepID=A0A8D8ACC2_CULPI
MSPKSSNSALSGSSWPKSFKLGQIRPSWRFANDAFSCPSLGSTKSVSVSSKDHPRSPPSPGMLTSRCSWRRFGASRSIPISTGNGSVQLTSSSRTNRRASAGHQWSTVTIVQSSNCAFRAARNRFAGS